VTIMADATYDYMYSVSRNADGSYNVPSGTPTQNVDLSSNQTVLSPGDEISISGAGGLNGNYDYVGSVPVSGGGSGFVVYNVVDQNFYMLTDNQVGGGDTVGSLTSTGPGSQAPVCFMSGTRILTSTGEVNVEDLKSGDLVLTTEGRAVPVRWMGRQTVLRAFADERNLPVRLKASALDDNVPSRDLLVSQQHALFVDGILVQAGALINGITIVREHDVPGKFVFHHIELDDHSLVLAEHTPTETFVDNVDRANFDNWHEYEALYPEGKAVPEMPYPRAKAHRQVPRAIRQKLAERVVAYGPSVASAA
jgi:Hint domain